MKATKIIPVTILTLALASAVDANLTSCSCKTVPDGWTKNFKIENHFNVDISWNYPEKKKALKIYYNIDEGKQICWQAVYTDINQLMYHWDVTNMVTNNTEEKYLNVPSEYVWYTYEFIITVWASY